MGTSSITLSPPHSLSSFPKTIFHSSNPPQNFTILQFQLRRLYPRVQASRRISNFPQVGLGIEDYADGDDDDDGDDDEEEQEEDRSLDLLVKFVENVFKKVSRRARKAVRSVLPVTISTKLVGFSVNGVILLAFLWILKAFLEVVCTIGSAVFVSILLVRGIWSGYPIYNKAATIGQMNTTTTIMHGLVHGLYLEFSTSQTENKFWMISGKRPDLAPVFGDYQNALAYVKNQQKLIVSGVDNESQHEHW